MAVDAPFPSLGEDPWGGKIITWANQVRQNVNELDQVVNEGRLSPDQLSATFVAVRTSDGQPLAPGTIVVITIDKTLAEITATPVADIADITFEEV